MKNTAIIIMMVITMIALNNCSNTSGKSADDNSVHPDTGKPSIRFKEYAHHFGDVKEGEKVAYVFTFQNTGSSDLVVLSTSTTCGCTVPKFSKKPVEPGETGTIEVVFDTSGRTGMQTKTISVKTNAEAPVVLLKITADVQSRK
jgi:hypothetical protein